MKFLKFLSNFLHFNSILLILNLNTCAKLDIKKLRRQSLKISSLWMKVKIFFPKRDAIASHKHNDS